MISFSPWKPGCRVPLWRQNHPWERAGQSICNFDCAKGPHVGRSYPKPRRWEHQGWAVSPGGDQDWPLLRKLGIFPLVISLTSSCRRKGRCTYTTVCVCTYIFYKTILCTCKDYSRSRAVFTIYVGKLSKNWSKNLHQRQIIKAQHLSNVYAASEVFWLPVQISLVSYKNIFSSNTEILLR